MRGRLAAWMLVAQVSCTCNEAQPEDAAPPDEPGPTLAPYAGPDNEQGPGLLPGGPVRASVRLAALPPDLVPESLRSIDPRLPITATLMRPVDGGHHHRLAWAQRAGRTWREVLPGGSSCDRFDDAECVAYPRATAAVISSGDQVRVDLLTGDPNDLRTPVELAPSGALDLTGDVAIRARGLHAALGHAGPAAIETASLELTRTDAALRFRVRWALAEPPSEPPSEPSSTAGAPSWQALCRDAVACFRTGPWPDVAGWLMTFPAVELPDDDRLAALTLWGSAWPHALAEQLRTLRSRLPEAARGFFDTAAAGLGEVAFAGGRLEPDGSALAFIRVPADQVNFAASLLAWAGRPASGATLADGTEVSWAPLSSGGVLLALDEGDAPTAGWIAYASTPEQLTWLRAAPRTAAGPPSLFVHLDRIDRISLLAPPLLDALGSHGATIRLEAEDDTIVLDGQLTPP